jgi:hypothetical protein
MMMAEKNQTTPFIGEADEANLITPKKTRTISDEAVVVVATG